MLPRAWAELGNLGLMDAPPFLKLGEEERVRGGGGDGGGLSHRAPPRTSPGRSPPLSTNWVGMVFST